MNPLTLRTWHLYISVFIAPSILFFALTGAMQLFSLHESHGTYDPPAILEKLGKVHKDQVFEEGRHKKEAPPAAPVAVAAVPADGAMAATPAAPAAGAEPEHHERQMRVSTMILKWFFLIVALGLTVSTCFGLWIALVQSRKKRTAIVLIVIGAAVPIALLLI